MQLKNSAETYGWISISFHWGMALLVLGMFGLGVYMVELSYVDAWYTKAPALHVSVGMFFLFLLLVRLVWRFTNIVPTIYGTTFEQTAGVWVHRAHYIFMLVLMVSGYLMVTADGRAVAVFDWFEFPALLAAEKGREEIAGDVHRWVAWGFMGFIALHAAAALKHHFINRDNTLLRMLGIKKGEQKQ